MPVIKVTQAQYDFLKERASKRSLNEVLDEVITKSLENGNLLTKKEVREVIREELERMKYELS